MMPIRARFRLFCPPPAARAVAFSVALAWTTAAGADALTDARKLVESGRSDEALRRTDAALLETPADPPLRFLRGVLLADAGRTADATAIFLRLTQDYPDLAEPYNNLATLYAAAGRYDEARDALEQALRVNPSYATAIENLGDVYAALAARAYGRTLRLDPDNRSAAPKLAAVRRAYLRGADQQAAAGRISTSTTTSPAASAPR